MSDEATPTPEPTAAPDAPIGPKAVMPTSILTKPTDAPVRPGFRNPANTKSKAQKKKK
jgi:hypothetical protein